MSDHINILYRNVLFRQVSVNFDFEKITLDRRIYIPGDIYTSAFQWVKVHGYLWLQIMLNVKCIAYITIIFFQSIVLRGDNTYGVFNVWHSMSDIKNSVCVIST